MNATREHDAFLNAIIDHPNDDLPRLVFADYLEETGDSARAEFIRVQCELAGGVANAGRKIALEKREKELLSQHLEMWRIPIRGYQTFQRGFVESLWTSANKLLESPSELISDSTLRTLRITNADQRIDDLAEYPGFSRIEHLDLTNNNLSGDYRLRAILSNPNLGRLRGLNLHNNRIWADDVLRIARSPVASQLTHLDLSGNGIGNEGVGHLANEASFTKLEVMILRSDGLPEYECIDSEGANRFWHFDHLRKLRELDVAGHHIREQGFMFLCLGLFHLNLERLNVARNGIGDRTGPHGGFIKGLSANTQQCRIHFVDFSNNALDEQEAEYLSQWPPLAEMQSFRLTGCEMNSDTRELLLSSPHAAKFNLDDGEKP